MFEQITLKDKNISEKAFYIYHYKKFTPINKEIITVLIDLKFLAQEKNFLNKKELEMQELETKKQLKEEVVEKLLGQNFMWFPIKLIKKSKKAP